MIAHFSDGVVSSKMREYIFRQKVHGTKQALPSLINPECLTVDHYFNDAMGALVVNLYAKVYGRKSDHVVVIKQPLDWWQAFRERWFPKVWLQAYPVKYKEIRVGAEEFLPYATPLKNDTVMIRRVFLLDEENPRE